MKIGNYELTVEEAADYVSTSKEKFFELMVRGLERSDVLESQIEDLEDELEITEEINDDLRADLELKDKTIRSLVEVCKHLVTRTPA